MDETVTPVMQEYLDLRSRRMKERQARGGDSDSEDRILEEMDSVWWRMTPDEIARIEPILERLRVAESGGAEPPP